MIISTHSQRDSLRPLGDWSAFPKSGVLKNARRKTTQITHIIKQTTLTKDDKDHGADNLSSSALIPHQDSDSTAGYHGTL